MTTSSNRVIWCLNNTNLLGEFDVDVVKGSGLNNDSVITYSIAKVLEYIENSIIPLETITENVIDAVSDFLTSYVCESKYISDDDFDYPKESEIIYLKILNFLEFNKPVLLALTYELKTISAEIRDFYNSKGILVGPIVSVCLNHREEVKHGLYAESSINLY